MYECGCGRTRRNEGSRAVGHQLDDFGGEVGGVDGEEGRGRVETYEKGGAGSRRQRAAVKSQGLDHRAWITGCGSPGGGESWQEMESMYECGCGRTWRNEGSRAVGHQLDDFG